MTATDERRRFWGWGRDKDDPYASQRDVLKMMLKMRLGDVSFAELSPPSIDAIDLPAPRFSPPASLAELFSQDRWERAGHTYGKAYRDVLRGLMGDFRAAPDAVALPRTEEDLIRILAFCDDHGLAAI